MSYRRDFYGHAPMCAGSQVRERGLVGCSPDGLALGVGLAWLGFSFSMGISLRFVGIQLLKCTFRRIYECLFFGVYDGGGGGGGGGVKS